MLLGNNYGVTIYKTAKELQPHHLDICRDCRSEFFQTAFVDKQAIVRALNKDHCTTSHWSK